MENTQKKDQPEEYTIGGIVDPSEVPNWARREPKWGKLIEAIEQLTPGQTLTVIFPDQGSANRARNTVRDTLNLRIGRAVIRTRVVVGDDKQVTTYFTRLRDNEVVEQERKLPD